MKISSENEKKLLSLLSEAIRRRFPNGLPLDWFHSTESYADLLERNGMLLADMMYNWTEFPKGFAPVDLGKEYYALIPDKLAMKALVLGHLDLK
jgi:hypothetical protein